MHKTHQPVRSPRAPHAHPGWWGIGSGWLLGGWILLGSPGNWAMAHANPPPPIPPQIQGLAGQVLHAELERLRLQEFQQWPPQAAPPLIQYCLPWVLDSPAPGQRLDTGTPAKCRPIPANLD